MAQQATPRPGRAGPVPTVCHTHRVSRLRLLIAVVTTATATLVAGTASAAPLAFSKCKGRPAVQCATLVVPLDRADPAKGTLRLHVERLPARTTRRGTIVLLAGGPGQAGTPVSPEDPVAAAIPGWDFVMFDQRGTGKGALRCTALDSRTSTETAKAVGRCAAQVGPNRVFYGSRDSALDIEDLRAGLGVESFALGGVSYGTYVSQYYAQMFPTRVSHLVLDSVVDPATFNGLDVPFYASTNPVLQGLCSGRRCRGITRDPVADVSTLVARTASTALRGRRTTMSGSVVRSSLGGPGNQGDFPYLLASGDLDIGLRRLWPGAARAAATGDASPMMRMLTIAISGGGPPPPTEISTALFWSTTCADTNAQWTSATPLDQRPALLQAAAAAQSAAFAPFSLTNATADSTGSRCTAWPDAAVDPLQPGPLPAVPTLLLAGGQDMRTPVASAQAVAARAPGSHLLIAPGAGHSVLGSLTCADDQLANLLAGRRVSTQACNREAPIPYPVPVPPADLGRVSPSGAPGTAGRVAHAARMAVRDGVDAMPAATDAGLDRLPGIRGGTARPLDFLGAEIRFTRFSAVRGVAITGTLSFNGNTFEGAVQVNGPGAWDGTLYLARGGQRAYTGSIGGVPVRIPLG